MIGKRYEYSAMALCEKDMWWYRCLHDLTLEAIKKGAPENPAILDAGCGTGGLLLRLKENGYSSLSGFDLSSDAVEYARKNSGVPVQLQDISNLEQIYPEKSFDVVVSHDMVCLLEKGRDRAAIVQLLKVLKPGGLLLMNFPSLKAFNGNHDIAVGIQQRYSKKNIRQMLPTNVSVKQLNFWPFFLSPAIFLIRKLQKVKSKLFKGQELISDVQMPPLLLNNAFYRITRLESRSIKKKPWGSSLFLVLQKLPE